MAKFSILLAASAGVLSVCAIAAVPAYASSPDIEIDTKAEAETNGTAANDGSIAIRDESSDSSAHAVAKFGSNAANNGGTATYSYANVVSTSYLSGYVTGNHVVYIVPASGGDGSDVDAFASASASTGTGGAGGSPLIDNSISMDNGAMSSFAGLNAQNLNTGVGASQNASINVSASLGALNLGRQ